jgi:hypothetical protein
MKTEVKSFDFREIEQMLGGSSNYRRMRVNKAQRWLAEMEAGRWVQPHPQPIIIGPGGVVLDGQHRLWAAAEFNRRTRRKIKFLVVTVSAAMSDDVSLTADTGTPRSIADHLRHVGAKNVTSVAAILRVAVNVPESGAITASLFDGGGPGAAVSQMADYYAKHREEVDAAAHVGVVASGRAHAACGTLLGTLALYTTRIDAEKSAQFFDLLGEGANLSAGSPVLRLRRYLQELRGTGSRRAVIRRAIVMATIIKAWNAWACGLELKQLKWAVNGSKPEAFPQIATPNDLLF